MSGQKYTKQNWICLVNYSCAEISDPYEVSRFSQELIFKLVKEVKLIRLCSAISCWHVPALILYETFF